MLAMQLLLISACGQPDSESGAVGIVHAYSLCPKTDDALERLSEQVKNFSNEQGARLTDRGDGAQQELSNMGSKVLDWTGGAPILLAVYKQNEFRVSVTNLGLREKVALTIRLWDVRPEASPVSGFVDELSRYWTIQEVERGVSDDPPC